jgi:asparagine synthase (glutamine-hydrolysing)
MVIERNKVEMCGIAGSFGEVDEESLRVMLAQQVHRGPDGQGMFINQRGKGALGHVRLSIMDPAKGQQPIKNENGFAAIVANGEVYNHEYLRSILRSSHRYISTSDSETILHFFEEKGLEMVKHLDGMYAFAIMEGDSLFMARDPIGIKPLYYGWQPKQNEEDVLYFASELKAISPFVNQINEFPPGSYFHTETGMHEYYRVPINIPRNLPVQIQAMDVRRTLEKSIQQRLMSDVPLGAFLSGGLDSSIIAAVARQYKDVLHTFSVGVEGSHDLLAARRIAEHIDSIHHEYHFTLDEVIDLLPEIIYSLESFDQDLVRSAIPTYLCSRLASEFVKVILTGEGADELFAGYTYYRDYQDDNFLHQELHRSVESLHNVNLQRVDRMTMAHGLEARVPFLSTEMIEIAQTIPIELKLRKMPCGQRIEKWILRKAFEDLLPEDIVWRDKEQFDEGSGTVDLMQAAIKRTIGNLDFYAYSDRYKQDNLRSIEECFYHKLLVESLDKPEGILENVGRWSSTRLTN